MDCLEVQQLLSQAVDREPVSAERLAEARSHCGSCESCAAFVRGLALTHRLEPPAEPAGLADRIVAAVRQEAEQAGSAADAPADAAAAATAGDEDSSTLRAAPVAGRADKAARARRRRSPVTIGAWVGAAAAVLIIASFAAVSGVRNIVSGPSETSLSDNRAERGFMTTPPAEDQSTKSDATASGSESEAPGTAAEATEANMISVNGFAYRLIGTSAVDRSQLTTFTTTTTSLDTDSQAQTYTVYKTPTGGRVALINGNEVLLFDLVTRSYESRPYALTSGALTSFTDWPTLPSSIPAPTTAQGAPTFVTAGLDDSGIEVFRLPTQSVSAGISVPPNTPLSDPARGDPNWTWWTPGP